MYREQLFFLTLKWVHHQLLISPKVVSCEEINHLVFVIELSSYDILLLLGFAVGKMFM
jgi:hypothetical protein